MSNLIVNDNRYCSSDVNIIKRSAADNIRVYFKVTILCYLFYSFPTFLRTFPCARNEIMTNNDYYCYYLYITYRYNITVSCVHNIITTHHIDIQKIFHAYARPWKYYTYHPTFRRYHHHHRHWHHDNDTILRESFIFIAPGHGYDTIFHVIY